jgi:hypothetical protein
VFGFCKAKGKEKKAVTLWQQPLCSVRRADFASHALHFPSAVIIHFHHNILSFEMQRNRFFVYKLVK